MSREKLQSIKEQPTSVNDELKSHVDRPSTFRQGLAAHRVGGPRTRHVGQTRSTKYEKDTSRD
jgi:hypothetical protein